jgi:hypothetical protein
MRTQKIHITKSLLWLEPYIEDVRPLLPELRLLKRITARSPKKNTREVQRIHAICYRFQNNTFQIGLMLHKQRVKRYKPKVEIKNVPYSKLDLLHYFAHELAHLRYWDHSPHRTILECKLNMIFMERAIKEGYISEEVEFNIPLNKYLDKITI